MIKQLIGNLLSGRRLIYVLVFVFITGMTFAGRHFVSQIKELKKQKQELISFNNSATQELERTKNKLNQEVVKTEELTLTNDNLKRLADDRIQGLLNQFSALKSDFRNLEQAFQIDSEIRSTDRVTTYDTTIVRSSKDTTVTYIKAKAFKFESQWKKGDGLVLSDSVIINQTIQVPLDGVVYWKRNFPLFGKKIYSTEFTSANPEVVITNLQNIKVRRRRKRR